MSLTVTRNPNLTRLQNINNTSESSLFDQWQDRWWTGLPPEKCPGFDSKRQCLTALPLLNLKICTRQDILDYFNNTWTLTELLFTSLRSEKTYTRSPYHQLRHPLMFYYGHPAVLFVNKLRLAGLVDQPLDLYLEKVLETGVDEMSWDDISKNEMNWPAVAVVHAYRKKVYELIKNLILTHPDLDRPAQTAYPQSPLWALWMGFEHEKIHFETSSVLIRELPIEEVVTPRYWPPLHPSAKNSKLLQEQSRWVEHKAEKVRVGKAIDVESFGWDNEYGQREVQLKAFQFTEKQITNAQYYEFVKSGSYVRDEYWSPEGLQWRKFRNTKRPTFWAAVGPEGSHEYELRTIFEFIPMPWQWPAEVNFHEAQAYCRWKNQLDQSKLHYRLLTEAEFNSLRGFEDDKVLQIKPYSRFDGYASNFPNYNFVWGSASDATPQIEGNVWHWLEDQFNPLENFEVHSLYDDFSTPCFDGKHQMIMGGSFISCGHEASRWARFHFRPHFYQHSGFRMAATLDGSADNGAVRLQENTNYQHVRRSNAIDQMNGSNWWKNVDQPLELNSQELKKLYESTEKALLKFDQNFPQVSPMGTAHDPSTNNIPLNYALPYQTTKDFPKHPESYEKLLKFVMEEMAPLSQWPGHPGYAAYVAGSANMISNLAQMVAQTLNPFTGHYMMAPGLVTLEAEVIQWFINLMGLPENESGGFLTTGSSLASLSALSMARQKLLKEKDYSKVTLYVSDQAHHCISKMWVTLGFAGENIRFIKSPAPHFKISLEELEKTIQADRKNGFTPLCVVGSAGTTNTGAIDDLKSIAALAKKHQAWFHVDGAYGALFRLTSKINALDGLELADSVVFDLHKALGLSYGTGCLLVRDKTHMRIAYPGSKSYMPPESDENANDLRVDFADISPELSRDYRGLRVWLPLKTWGISPFVVNLEEKLKLSDWIHDELKKTAGVEIMAAPQLSIQAFALKTGRGLEADNLATQKLLEKINLQGTLFVSGCTLEGRRCVRLCLLGFRMHYSRLEKALQEIKKFSKELIGN